MAQSHNEDATFVNEQIDGYFYIEHHLDDQMKLKNSLLSNIRSEEASFHLFSHGKSGQLLLDGQWRNPKEIVHWFSQNQFLNNKTQLNIYGCEFGKDEKGRKAVDYLEATLGLSVAASDDLTGVDGDWVLEVGNPTNSIECPNYNFNLQSCDCVEYIYLNEPIGVSGQGQVHKFSIDPATGSLTEILNSGNAWYPGANVGMSELPSPHGLAIDINGNVYVGETAGGDIRKLDCDGNMEPVANYEIDRGGFNFVTLGNTIFVNPGNAQAIQAYDLCTQTLINEACLNGMAASAEIDWGLTITDNGTLYATSGFGNNFTQAKMWIIEQSDFGTGICIDPFIEESPTGADPGPGDSFLPDSELRGIVLDDLGNIYIVERAGRDARVHKYDSNGVWLAATPFDTNANDGGYHQAQGIVYSSGSGYLYVSTISRTDDCVSIIDPTTMTYVAVGVPSPGSGAAAKGIALVKSCCPATTPITIDTTLCAATVGTSLFLQDIINCDGNICEGTWAEDPLNIGLTYDACDNSITIQNINACGTYTIESDGTGNNPQCGAFSITVNIEVENIVAPTIAGTQPLCANDNNPPAITSSGGASSGTIMYQWQMSTTDCSTGFSDISGATSNSYDPPILTTETYYRLITQVNDTCNSGACSDTTNCVTLTPESGCAPVCTNPTASIFAFQPSCTDGAPNSDGYLQLSSVTNGDRVAFSTGNTFTGDTNYANAMTIGALPFQFANGQANPSGSQVYTIRIFNGASNCFTDVLVTMNQQDCTVGCDCEEYLYLNETTNNGMVHKFVINENYNPATDPASAALSSEIGNPWYDNTAAGETLNSPHGLGVDLNGFLYIGEIGNSDNGAAIRRFTCDGEIIPSSTFEIPDEGGKNFASANGILYVNTDSGDSPTIAENVINAYDLCTGGLIGYYCLDGIESRRDWGMYLEEDGTMYLTSSYLPANQTSQPDNLWKFNINTTVLNPPGSTTPTCISPFLTETSSPPTIGQNHLARGLLWGVTVDNNGNIYIVETTQNSELDKPASSVGFRTARILKYDSNGVLVAMTPWDTAEDGTGWYRAIGIYYNETIDKLFVSTTSGVDDCVALFDTSLNYLGAAVPSPGDGSQGKGINVLGECCPTNNNVTIDTTLCAASLNDEFYLQEIINCNGTICEGTWQEGGSNSGITYNACDNSITIEALNACGSFILESDGIGNNAQCSAFKITVNIEVGDVIAPVIAGNQTVCAGGDPVAFSVSTAAAGTNTITYQWQSSIASCTTGFTDISNTNNSTYDPPNGITQTTYYRVITSVDGGCNTEMCTDTSNCITITVENNPVLTATNSMICEGQTIDLSGLFSSSLSGNMTYHAGNPPSAANQLGSTTVSPTTTRMYYGLVVTPPGCSDTTMVTVTVNPVDTTDISATICNGDIYVFNDQNLTTIGTYLDTLMQTNGCDSIIRLDLMVTSIPDLATTNATICEGENVDLTTLVTDNNTAAGTATYHSAYPTSTGNELGATTVSPSTTTKYYVFKGGATCNDVDSILITINPVDTTGFSASICQGDTYAFNNQSLATAGTYLDTLMQTNGCDSIIRLVLTVTPTPDLAATNGAICEGGSIDLTTLVTDNNSTAGSETYHSAFPTNTGNELSATTVMPTTATKYYVFKGGMACNDVDSLTININPLPTCSITGNSTVAPNAQNQLYFGPSGMATYAWSITAGDAVIDGASNVQSVTIDFGTAASTIQLTITDANGCTSTCSISPVGGDFDLALLKDLSDGQSDTINLGDDVDYTIRVFNEGDITATNIEVCDIIPDGMVLSPLDANGWDDTNPDTVYQSIAGPLAPGDTITVDIKLRVVYGGAGSSLTNIAEITEAQDGAGTTITDVDSTPANGDPQEDDIETEMVQLLDHDPTGWIYCDKTGKVITGGMLSITGPNGIPNDEVNIVHDGTNGYYEFYATGTAGTYTITYNHPDGVTLSTTKLPMTPALDPTGMASPVVLGVDTLAGGMYLSDTAFANNPYYLQFDFELGDPPILLNNLPVRCAFIGSIVCLDDDINGVDDGDEPPFPGTTVYLYDCADATTPLDSTVTDADGKLAFDGLLPGDYMLQYNVPDGHQIISSQADTLTNGFTSCMTLDWGDCDTSKVVCLSRIFDVALKKEVSTPGPYQGGDDVTFEITVYNQGTATATNLVVYDYIPTGLVLNDSNWDEISPQVAEETIATLAGGDSTILYITLRINSSFSGNLVNNAEIVSADGGIDEDSPLATTNDGSTNELATDNNVNDDGPNTPGTGDLPSDEDDYDPALIQVECPEPVCLPIQTNQN